MKEQMDDIFRDALENIKVDYQPGAWQDMSNRLEALENVLLDDSIKDALEHIEVDYQPEAWKDISNRMEALEDDLLDDTIKSQLNSFHAQYQHKHWLHLKDWLDYAWYASNKVYVSKVAEALLMILALFTFYNQTSHTTQTKFAQTEQVSKVDRTSAMMNDGVTNTQSSESTATHATESATASVFSQTDLSQRGAPTKAVTSTSNKSEATLSVTTHADKGAGQTNGLAPKNDKVSTNSASQTSRIEDHKTSETSPILKVERNTFDKTQKQDAIPFLPSSLINPVFNSEKTIVDDKKPIASNQSTAIHTINNLMNENQALKNDVVLAFNDNNNSATNALDILPLENINYVSDVDENIAGIALHVDKKKQKLWSISAYADLDFNHITTPYDDLYEKSGYDQNRVGAGGGLMVHRQVGPVELSTGLGYSSKQYDPQRFVELFTKSDEVDATQFTFDGVNLNVLSIPLHASYHINKSGKWRTYATFGGTAHLALQAQYERDFERIPQNQVRGAALAVENNGGTVTEGRTPNFEKKKFPDGILEDGNFNDNHYFTLDLGFGAERRISKNTSLFIQPTVYYNLFNKGLSANDDIINTFALQIGVKTKI